MRHDVSRRSFVKGVAAAAVGMPCVIASSALGLADARPASTRVALGCIGTGGRGQYNMGQLLGFGGQVVAVSDVRASAREEACRLANIPTSAAYNEFERVLERKDVDAVMIATPDHWHVPIAIAAARAKKDVYCEKPLGRTIAEGKAIRQAVQEHKIVFMHGTEQRGMPDVRKVCELVRNGRLGKLHTITVGCPGGQEVGDQPEMPVPPDLDYERWLGPAKLAPYTELRVAKGGHFFISDYCPSGYVCGWGVHHLDIAQWAMGTDDSGPIEISGKGVYPKGGLFDTALSWRIEYLYANGVRMVFTDTSQNPEGVKFEGTEGWIFKAYRQPAEAGPTSLLTSELGSNAVRLYETQADDYCFLECVESRKETCSPIEAAHRSSTIGYLGDIAMRLGRTLKWDPEKECFKNDAEADKWLSRPLRAPWHL